MFDLTNATTVSTRPAVHPMPPTGSATPPQAMGAAPERDTRPAAGATPITTLLACALDEVDVGVLLLDADGRLLHANHSARHVLADDDHPLRLRDGRLAARDPRALARLLDALREAALRGLRRMLALGDDGHAGGPRLVALVPALPGVAALLLGRARMCEELSLQCYARSHGLTGAEARVLAGLGRGESPAEIARAQGVKLSTVRTQIAAIRDKTGVGGITELVRLVASLPPMVSALRH
jgi:DNA-binding CsgD family transcriptional regulator